MKVASIICLLAFLHLFIARGEESPVQVLEGYADTSGVRDASIPTLSSDEMTIRLKFHVVRTSRFDDAEDLMGADLDARLVSLVDLLNSIYAPAAIAFELQDFATPFVPESPELLEVDSSDEKRRLMDSVITGQDPVYNLNVVVVPIRNLGFDGHAHFPWSRASLRDGSGVMISDQYVFPAKVDGVEGSVDPQILAHEIGHALGLWHVERGVNEHEIGGLKEEYISALKQEPGLVSTSGADLRGDFCWDTPPVTDEGELDLIYRIEDSDSDGVDEVVYLKPLAPEYPWIAKDVGNLMRGSGDRRFLSAQQSGRLRAWLESRLSSWLIGETGRPERLLSDLVFDDTADFKPGVELKWYGPAGSSYVVERSGNPMFTEPVPISGTPVSTPVSSLPERNGYAELKLVDEDPAIKAGEEFWYRVTTNGKSTYSRRMSVRAAGSRTGNARPSEIPHLEDEQVRSVPRGVLIEWEDPDDVDVTGYEIRRWEKIAGSFQSEQIIATVAAGTSKIASYFDNEEKADEESFGYQVLAYFQNGIGAEGRIRSGNESDGPEQGAEHSYTATPKPAPPVLSYAKIPTVGLSYTGVVGVDFPGKVPAPTSGGGNTMIDATVRLYKDADEAPLAENTFSLEAGTNPRIVEIGDLDTGANYHATIELSEDVVLGSGETVPRIHGRSEPITLRIPGKIIYAPAVVGPSDGSIQPSYPTFTWKSVQDAVEYVITYIRIGGGEPIEIVVSATQLSYTFGPGDHELDALSQYEWTVAGHNEEGFGPGSTGRTFTTGLRPVRLISPAEGSLVSAPANVDAFFPRFEWDGMPGEVSYRIRIWDEEGDQVFGQKDVDHNFFQETDPLEALPAGTYTWLVRTYERGGNPNLEPTLPSLTGSFSLRTRPVGPPSQQAPAEDSIDRLARPTFKWDPVAQATDYSIEVIRNNDTSIRYRFGGTSDDNLLRDASGDPVLLTGEPDAEGRLTFKIPSELPGLGGSRLHYWRIKARNEIDSGIWSAPNRPEDSGDWKTGWWGFRTGLGRPDLVSPANHATVSSRHPTFTWTEVSGATTYEVEVIKSGTVRASATVGPNDGAPFWNMPASEELPSSPDYVWRVRAKGPPDDTTIGPWTDTFALTIYAEPSNAPTQLSPPDNHVDLDTLPFFQWDALQQATSYDLEIVQIRPNGSAKAAVSFSGISGTVFYVPEANRFKGDRQHFWRVRGENSVGTGPWSGTAANRSDWFEFRTKLEKPVLLTPVNGKTNETTTPTFDWADVSGADSYVFEMWGPNNNRLDGRTQTTTDSILGNNVNSPLTSSKQYYWRVKAVGSTTESEFSEFFAIMAN